MAYKIKHTKSRFITNKIFSSQIFGRIRKSKFNTVRVGLYKHVEGLTRSYYLGAGDKHIASYGDKTKLVNIVGSSISVIAGVSYLKGVFTMLRNALGNCKLPFRVTVASLENLTVVYNDTVELYIEAGQLYL